MSMDKIECEGTVSIARGNGMFEITLDEDGEKILCTISGKMKKNNIRILEGDKVRVEVSLYDPKDSRKGRITYRKKG